MKNARSPEADRGEATCSSSQDGVGEGRGLRDPGPGLWEPRQVRVSPDPVSGLGAVLNPPTQGDQEEYMILGDESKLDTTPACSPQTAPGGSYSVI